MGCAQSTAMATSWNPPPHLHDGRPVREAWGAAGDSKVEQQQELRAGWCESRSFHDDYLISHRLGAGAFAAVYAARPAAEGGGAGPLAVKVTDLREEKEDSFDDCDVCDRRRQEVANEVAVLQQVKGQQHVVSIIEAFVSGALSYIVMERCEQSLGQMLQHMPTLTENTLKGVLAEMLMGLAAVHAVGVVHGDVKPDNFLCTSGDADAAVVKLCDFGFARQLASSDPDAVGLRGVYGTAPYMAPEMLRKELYGTKVDLWAFGAVAYTLFFGAFPYMPPERTRQAVKIAIREGTHAPTFQPKPGLKYEGGRECISNGGKFLLRRLLFREPRGRPAAKVALKDPFFFSSAAAPGSPMACLKPMLRSAQELGAFQEAACCKKTEVDRWLAHLQEKRHGASPRLSGKSLSSEGSTASGCSGVSVLASGGGLVESVSSSTMAF